ncbi:hypothetical protein HOLleu_34564 [Holothuria leucospilota]|uniref:Uncharacterized protein n=1 Tax=Holothuria leucospilota TaxID=206669 RepID=A0A9Q1BH82_HOLLE|nr:hypothetical protein HOLleu_34564 [Holothuria leucospilota]
MLHSKRKQTGSGDRQKGVDKRALFNRTKPIKRESYKQTRVVTEGHQRVFLRVLPVKAKYEGPEVSWAPLDDGSDTSFCKQSLADELGIKKNKENILLTTVNGAGVRRKGMPVSLTVEGLQGGRPDDKLEAWTLESLSVSHRSVPQREEIDQWPHLRGIQLHSAEAPNIRLLIGSDALEVFWVQEERRGKERSHMPSEPL